MPIWAYVYCALFVVSCCFSLYDKDRLKRVYQPAGEILDALSGILVFLIGFSVIQFESSTLVSILCFVYTFAWSYHAHSHYLNYEKFKSDIHQSVLEDHEKKRQELDDLKRKAFEEGIDPDDFEEFTEEYNYDETEKVAHSFYIGVIVIIDLLLAPYIYVFLKAVGAIGS